MDIDKILSTSKHHFALKKILDSSNFCIKKTGTNTLTVSLLDHKPTVGKYELFFQDKNIASFELHPMINCCGVCISTKAFVSPEWRGKGLGTTLNLLRIDIARADGYGLLMCTDIESNVYQRKVLKANGWRDLHSFINPRTKNRVYISVINL